MTDDQSLRVVVVDDSPGAAGNLATLVSARGYATAIAR
jgi:hypothetical protein